MTDYDSRHENNNGKKRRKLNNENIDVDEEDEDPRLPQNPLTVLFRGQVVLSEALPYLDVVSLVDKKRVCRQWRERCNAAINNKGREGEKRFFVDNAELRDAVKKYCKGNRDETEEIAAEFGYPIGKWDVSRVEDFSYVFCDMTTFNEDIGAWDVGNATDMNSMFECAKCFDRDLSDWDVSNVKDMKGMFQYAHAFNGDVSAWDTSNVANMSGMFFRAIAFHGDTSAWDTSGITNRSSMFRCANVF